MITRPLYEKEALNLVEAAILDRLRELNHKLVHSEPESYATIKGFSKVYDMVLPIETDFPNNMFNITWIHVLELNKGYYKIEMLTNSI